MNALLGFYLKTGKSFFEVRYESVIDENSDFKFTDFNYCILDEKYNSGKCVSGDYQSPENAQNICNYQTEIWSLGNLLFEMYGNISQLDKPIGQTFN